MSEHAPVESTHPSASQPPMGHSRRRFLGGLGGAGAAAAIAATVLIEDPAAAAFDDKAGPNFIRVIDVTYFKEDGQGEDWTGPINSALAAARTLNDMSPVRKNLPVYFPSGVYGISDPLHVAGLRLIGEPPGYSVSGGTVIKALKDFGKANLFADGVIVKSVADTNARPKQAKLPKIYDSGVPMLFIGGTQNSAEGKKADKDGNITDVIYGLYGSTQRFHMSGITLVAGYEGDSTHDPEWYADYCLALFGGVEPRIDDVRCFGGKLDGILIDGGNPILTDITVDRVYRHAIHMMNANGMSLSNFFINYGFDKSGKNGKGSALRLEGSRTTPVVPKRKPSDPDYTGGSGGAATISRGQTGDFAVHDASVDAAPAIHATNLGGSRITNVYIEAGNCSSAIKLEGCEGVRLEDCRMTTSRALKDASMIHLAVGRKLDDKGQPATNEKGDPVVVASTYNVVRGNYGANNQCTDEGQPEWVKTVGSKYLIRIRVDPTCRNNHISDNMRAQAGGEEMIVWYPRSGGPVQPPGTVETDPKTGEKVNTLEQEYVPTTRTHTVGQHKSINYGKTPPTISEATNGSWRIGDVIFNSAPKPGDPIGWVCCSNDKDHGGQGGVIFNGFGEIGGTP